MDGKLVKSLSENELSSKMILVSNIPNGIYYINFTSGEKNLVAKFIKNN